MRELALALFVLMLLTILGWGCAFVQHEAAQSAYQEGYERGVDHGYEEGWKDAGKLWQINP